MNPYKILGITRQATVEQARAAFLKLSKKHHPDKGGDPEAYVNMTAAYTLLGHETPRRHYEAKLYLEQDPCPICGGEGQTVKREGPKLLRVVATCQTCWGSGFLERRPRK